MEQACKTDSDISEQSSKPFSDLLQAPPPPPPFMNRKMRRRGFHDPPRTPEPATQNVAEVGVIDFNVQVESLFVILSYLLFLIVVDFLSYISSVIADI